MRDVTSPVVLPCSGPVASPGQCSSFKRLLLSPVLPLPTPSLSSKPFPEYEARDLEGDARPGSAVSSTSV